MADHESEPLIIVGAGGLGREIYSWCLSAADETGLNPVAFCDDRTDLDLTKFGIDLPIAPAEVIVERFPSSRFVIAVGDGRNRAALAARMLALGALPATIVHPSVVLGLNVELGVGTIICPGSVITTQVQIGKFSLVNCSCNIGHDVIVGDYCTFMGNNSINGDVVIGDYVTLGSGAIVHPRLKVGASATIGIGSVALRNVPAGTTVFGVPARNLGRSFCDDLISEASAPE